MIVGMAKREGNPARAVGGRVMKKLVNSSDLRAIASKRGVALSVLPRTPTLDPENDSNRIRTRLGWPGSFC